MQSKIEELKAKYEAAFRAAMAKAKAADEAGLAAMNLRDASKKASDEAAALGRELMDAIRAGAMSDAQNVAAMGTFIDRHGTPVCIDFGLMEGR